MKANTISSQVTVVATNSTGSWAYSAEQQANGWLHRPLGFGSRGIYSIQDELIDYEFKVESGQYSFRRKSDGSQPNLPVVKRRSWFGHWLSEKGGSAPLAIAKEGDFVPVNGLTIGENKLKVLSVHRSFLVDGKLPSSKLPRHLAVIVEQNGQKLAVGANFTPATNNDTEKKTQLFGLKEAKLVESVPLTPKKSVGKTGNAKKQVKVN